MGKSGRTAPVEVVGVKQDADLAVVASSINQAHDGARQAAGTALEWARVCGELLQQAKAQMKHGAWLPWLKANTTVSPRTAQLYMQVAANAEALQANAQRVAHLGLQKAIRFLAGEEKKQAIHLAAVACEQAVLAEVRETIRTMPRCVLPPDVAERVAELRRARRNEMDKITAAEAALTEEMQERLERGFAAIHAEAQPRIDRIDAEIERLEEQGVFRDAGEVAA